MSDVRTANCSNRRYGRLCMSSIGKSRASVSQSVSQLSVNGTLRDIWLSESHTAPKSVKKLLSELP